MQVLELKSWGTDQWSVSRHCQIDQGFLERDRDYRQISSPSFMRILKVPIRLQHKLDRIFSKTKKRTASILKLFSF